MNTTSDEMVWASFFLNNTLEKMVVNQDETDLFLAYTDTGGSQDVYIASYDVTDSSNNQNNGGSEDPDKDGGFDGEDGPPGRYLRSLRYLFVLSFALVFKKIFLNTIV